MAKSKTLKINSFNTGQVVGYFTSNDIKPYKLQNLFTDAVTNILTPSFAPSKNQRGYTQANKITHFTKTINYTWGAGDNGSSVLKIFGLSSPASDSGSNWSDGTVITGTNTTGSQSISAYNNALYGIDGGGKCWELPIPSETPGTPNASYGSADRAATSNGVIAKDDQLYIATGYSVCRIGKSSLFQKNVISIPVDYNIVQLIPFGNYLALVCRNTSTVGNTALFLWDLISDDVTESNYFSEERLLGAGYVGSKIYIFTTNGGSLGIGLNPHITVWSYSGGQPQYVTRFDIDGMFPYGTFTTNVTNIFPSPTGISTSSGNCIYIPIRFYSEDTKYGGFFVLDGNGSTPMFYFDQIQTGDIEPSQISFWNDTYVFGAYDYTADEYDTYYAPNARTRASGVFETTVFTGENSDVDKQLNLLTVFTRPLPANATITVKYRIDGSTTWNTIATESTDGVTFHTSSNIESTGANLETFKEIQIRVESTLGAEIVGLKMKITELNSLYE